MDIIFSKKWLGEETDRVKPEQRRPFDFLGFLLLAGSITALLLGMTEVSQGKGFLRFDTGGILLIGIALLIVFLFLPSTHNPGNAIVNIYLLKHRSVAAASATIFFAGGTLYAAQFLFPLFWQNTVDASALEAAFMLLPQGVGALLTRTAAGRLTDKYGGHIVATGGFLACVITTAAVASAVSSAASGNSNASDFSLPIILLLIIAAAGAGCSLLFPRKKE